MTIRQRAVSLIVSQDGQQVLGIAAGLPASQSYSFIADEANDLGLWVKIEREDGEHLQLIRWGIRPGHRR